MKAIKWRSISAFVFIIGNFHAGWADNTTITGDAISSSFTFTGPITISSLTAYGATLTTATISSGTITNLTVGNVFGLSGRLVQLKAASYQTNTVTTSTSYQDTGLSISFTPTSLVSTMVVVACETAGSLRSGDVILHLVRDSTAISGNTLGFYFNSDTNLVAAGGGNVCLMEYDVPASTSAVTYKTQFKSDAGQTVFVNGDGSTAYTNVIRVLEFQ